MTRQLVLINLVFLLFVSLLPFSAAMLGRFQHAPVAIWIYYGHQLLLSLLLAMQWEIVIHKAITTDAAGAVERSVQRRRLWTIPVACVVALVTSAIRPEVAQTAFLGTVVVGRIATR
jgi:uncharacterized membrane protein